MSGGKISPSIMCANLMNLESDIREFEKAGIEYLHIDIMDGSFVPNYTLGTDFIAKLRKATNIPLDIHLMINEPERKLDWFDFQPSEYVAIHYETTNHVQRVLQNIRDKGAKSMLALNPATPLCVLEDVAVDLDAILIMTVNPGYAGQKLVPQTLDKIARARAMYPHLEIEVDGNVSYENAKKMRAAGADIFVGGTAGLFMKDKTFAECAAELRKCIV